MATACRSFKGIIMKITRSQLHRIIKEVYQSHTVEPRIGDMVVNVNPGCKHHESEGLVLGVNPLPDDLGMSVAYECTNSGDNWEKGDVLEKTMDQLEPMPTQVSEAILRPLIRKIIKEEARAHHLREGEVVASAVGYNPIFAEWSPDGLTMEISQTDGGKMKFSRQKDVENLITMLEELLAGPMRTSP
jgi:RNase P protein component